MQTKRPVSHYLYGIISPLFPFYVLGLQPGPVLWPVIFLPAIFIANYAWALVLATATVVVLGQTEHVGQRILVRYALWATISGLLIDIAHDATIAWLGQRVDFLLQTQPWQLVGSTYLVPCTLIFLYHLLLAWQYLRLPLWQSAIMGVSFAVLTAPWTTLIALNLGQGRMPLAGQRLLTLSIVILAASPWLVALGAGALRRARSAPRFVGGLFLAGLALLTAGGGGLVWMNAVTTPALDTFGASGTMGDLAFATHDRVYAIRSSDSQVRSLGSLRGDVVAWSPNGRLLLVNEDRADGKSTVAVLSADDKGTSRTLGAGQAAAGAWSPDSSMVVYSVPGEPTGQIRIVRADGSGDRMLAEGRMPSWSPDGRRIIFTGRSAGKWQVWVMLPTGGDPIQLTSDGGEDPLWSPDGRFIAYILNNRIVVMDSDGMNKRRLPVDNTYVDVKPVLSWASDGSRLAYIYLYPAESGRPAQLYIWETSMPAAPLGSALLPLGTPTPTPAKGLNRSGDFSPPFSWTPDGVWLGFLRHGDLWVLNTRTGEERRQVPADSFAWGMRTSGVAIHPVPTYPATPTPTPLPATVVESPAILVLDAKDPTLILAGTTSGVVRKAGSGGWFLNNNGINYPTNVRALAIDPSDNNVIYAGTDGQRAIAGTLYKSIDGGNRWFSSGLKDIDIYCLTIDPAQPKNLYAGTSKGIYTSSDAGVTWSQHNNGLKTNIIQTLAIDPARPTSTGRGTPTISGPVLYAGTRQGEVYKTTNGGNEWKLVQTLNSPITQIVAASRKPGIFFAATEDGLFVSNDDGDTWNQVSGGIWKVRLIGVVPAPKDNTIYAYGVSGVFVSHDGGTNWGPASSGLEGMQPTALVCHPTDASILIVGTDKGVLRTANGGVTWSR